MATAPDLTKQKLPAANESETARGDGKSIGASEKSFLFEGSSVVANRMKTTTTSEASDATDSSNKTSTRYDVEHLATFATASSHEQLQQVETSTNNDDPDGLATSSKSSRFKKQTPKKSSATTEPREALQKLFELEKLSGIWTQRMQIELQQDFMLIVDCETDAIVERFHRDRVTRPEAFNQYNDIYNNIIVFVIDQQQVGKQESNTSQEQEVCDKSPGELHIFQCVSHGAKQLVADIQAWKRGHISENNTKSSDNNSNKLAPTIDSSKGNKQGMKKEDTTTNSCKMPSNQMRDAKKEVEAKPTDSNQTSSPPKESNGQKQPPVVRVASSTKPSEPVPIVNVNVKETVQVFNQIAALREKSSAVSSSNSNNGQARPLSDASSSSQSGSGLTGSQSGAGGELGRTPLTTGGQLYKQRSIRATLAPKSAASSTSSGSESAPATRPTSGNKSQDQPASSSSAAHSMTSANELANKPATAATQLNQMQPGSGAPGGNDHHHGSNEHHNFSHHQKHTSGHPLTQGGGANNQSNPSNPSNSHTQSGHHNHNHHHQHNQQHGSSARSKSSNGNKLAASSSSSSSSSSRLQQSASSSGDGGGHHHHNHHAPSNSLGNGHNNNNNNNGVSYGIQSSGSSGRSRGSPSSQPLEQINSNESYVSVLNHCFDDIEKFIIRIQTAYTAMRELQAKKRQTKRTASSSQTCLIKSHHSSANGPLPPAPLSVSELAMLGAQARGPSADDFFEILSKFKLAFNLLAKLKGCIHEPNAPELVHFLFTPLAIIIESARNVTPPVDPTVVGIPYLNKDALDLLSNCCTSKESDLWLSLGPNWTETIDAQLLKASRLPSSFQPIFSDGWAPVINELELIGLMVAPPAPEADHYHPGHHHLGRSSQAGQQSMIEEPLAAAAARKPKKKRSSPSGGARYMEPTSGYAAASSGDMIEGPLPIVDVTRHAAGGHYRVPELPTSQQHMSARHSMPMNEQKPGRAGAVSKHPDGGGSGSRGSSEYMGQSYGHYAPPMLNGGFVGGIPQDDLLPHSQGYPSYATGNPSDGYTELQDNGHCHYLAGPSSRHDAEYLSRYAANGYHGGRKGSKNLSGYNSRGQYLAEAPYAPDEDLRLGPGVVNGGELLINEAEREAMIADLGPAQTEWFYELKMRGSLIVRVLFTREANNDKELSVKRGEILEILDDTRKWWKARSIDLQVAYVPHTIVAIMEHYQTLDELLTGSSSDMMMMAGEDQGAVNPMQPQRYDTRRDSAGGGLNYRQGNQSYGFREERRNSKTAKGAFRYF